MSIDAVIRPDNGLLLFALQSAEGTPAALSAATDVILADCDSIDYNSPYKSESVKEANGTFAASAPMVIGQPFTFSFKSRIKGAGPGTTYTNSVKPPLHPAFMACGWYGQFTAAVAAAALTAGTAQSGTLGTGFASTAQIYRGMPLILSGAPAAGRMPLITDYSAGKLATLADLFGSVLTTGNTAALPANWTYAPTSPTDSASRIAMHPCGTLGWYEDGRLHQITDVRGTLDLDGNTSKPGFATFNMSGIYAGPQDASMPSNAVFPNHSAPMLVQGASAQPVLQLNRRGLAISKWSMKTGAALETPEDPNSTYGFGAGQIADRMIVLEADPLQTMVAVRDILTEIGNFSQYPAALQHGSVAGNRWSLLHPVVQPFDTTPGKRGKLRSEQNKYQAISPGRDNAGRDGDAILCFS